MSISGCHVIGSPELVQSSTTLKAFEGRAFQPHGILTALPIKLGGKTLNINVEVVDAPLDYNILLECIWFNARKAVVSLVFRLLCFPHQSQIVYIDPLTYYMFQPF